MKLPPLPSSHEESYFMYQWTNSLKAHNLSKMEIDHPNSPATIKETEFVIKNFLEKNRLAHIVSLENSTKCLKKN